MALSADRNTQRRAGEDFEIPVGAGAKIYAGALVALIAATGYATPGAAALGLIGLGRAEARADNSGGQDGDIKVKLRVGVFRWANSAGGDEVTLAQVGQACFIVDDQTVAKTNGGGTRSPAGTVVDVDAQGVWVRSHLQQLATPAGALLAANNLSDVAAAATARASIGANRIFLPIAAADLSGVDVYRVAAPVAGTITKIWSVLSAALADGDATLTAKIGAVAVTNGVITVTQVGSAAGDVDSATPTAANVVAAGDVVSLTVGGANSAAVGADVLVEITF